MGWCAREDSHTRFTLVWRHFQREEEGRLELEAKGGAQGSQRRRGKEDQSRSRRAVECRWGHRRSDINESLI